jgi:hypothetical protein
MAIKYDFDPEKLTGIKIARGAKRDALDEVADFVKEAILSNTADGKSSVKGGHWKKKITKPYWKNVKSEESNANFANMELTGDMLDALETRVVSGKVRIEIAGDQADKAEGNLLGSYGREPDTSKAREFMPHKRGQELSPDIVAGIKDILERYEEE